MHAETLQNASPPAPAAAGRPAATIPPRVRFVLAFVTIIILVFPVVDLAMAALKPNFNGYGAIDYTLYMEATQRWLGGGPFYEPYQLNGPYPIRMGDVLYPPNGLLLFVPFTFLPAALWWAVPLGITAWAVWRMRPSPVAWPFIALCLFWPAFVARTVAGNPVIWVMAAVALGCLYKWPSIFVLLKPSLFPFALIGIRDRSWWIALAAWALVSLPFGLMWLDWTRAVTNSTGGGLLYSFQDIPILLLPVIAAKMR